MAQRKGINNFLSRLPNPEPEAPEKALSPPGTGSKPHKSNLFERLNAVSALDAEPDLSRIARNVSLFAARPAVRPDQTPDGQASEMTETVKKVAPARPPRLKGAKLNAATAAPLDAPETAAVSIEKNTPPAADAAGPATVSTSSNAPGKSASDPPQILFGTPHTVLTNPAPITPAPAGDFSSSFPGALSSETVRGESAVPKAKAVVSPGLDGQTKWSDQMVRPNGQTSQTKWSDQMVYPVRPNGLTKWSDHLVRPYGLTTTLSPVKPLTKTRQQKTVFGYLAANPDIITSINNLSEILSIPPTTLRKTLTLFERAGRIRKSRIGNDGLKIVFCNPTWSDQMVRPNGQSIWSDQNCSKIDRENSSLSISLQTFELTWPHLHRTGFGPEQIEQARQNLASQNKPTDRLLRSLDHAEWELEHDCMTDKDGNTVSDPCSWVFTSLARTGYYRRPVGYVSPEEQAARDAEQEAKAVTAARKQAETASFEAWRDALTPDDRDRAMTGYPGGPRDTWLRAYWKRQQEAAMTAKPEDASDGRGK